MVGVRELAAPVFGRRQLGAVAGHDVGQDRGRLALAVLLHLVRLPGGLAGAEALQPVVAGDLRRGRWPGGRISLAGRAGHHERRPAPQPQRAHDRRADQ